MVVILVSSVGSMCNSLVLFFECYGDHRDLHVLTHSFPTRRSTDLKAYPLAKHFIEIRNDVVHKGRNPVNKVTLEHLRESLSRQLHFHDHSHVLVIPDATQNGRSTLANAVPACTALFV